MAKNNKYVQSVISKSVTLFCLDVREGSPLVLWLCRLLLYFILVTNNFGQVTFSRNDFS